MAGTGSGIHIRPRRYRHRSNEKAKVRKCDRITGSAMLVPQGEDTRSWVERAIWWQVYPLGFVGAEREACACAGVAYRLGHLGAWLDYVVNLGASGIMLG